MAENSGSDLQRWAGQMRPSLTGPSSCTCYIFRFFFAHIFALAFAQLVLFMHLSFRLFKWTSPYATRESWAGTLPSVSHSI